MKPPTFNNVPSVSHTSKETGETIFNSRASAVCVRFMLIIDGVQYCLVTRRAKDMPNGGLWCLPCGYLDFGETRLEAARRELYEETGLIVDLSHFKKVETVDDPARDDLQNITTHYDIIIVQSPWMLKYLEDQLDFQEEEVEEGGFKTRAEIAKLDFAFNHKKRILNFPLATRNNLV